MNWKAVLFDMDGTVLDTLDDLVDSVNRSLAEFSLPPVDSSVVRRNLGNGAAFLIAHCVPPRTEEDLCTRVLEFYKPWYDAHCKIHTRPYDGILPLMQKLRAHGLRLAVISNKPDTAVQELAAVFFPGMLDVVVGESPGIRRKPSPDTVLEAISRMGLAVEDCVYIGDSEVDIETARSAGMVCISVSWGFRDEEALFSSGASILVHTPEELSERILQ
ncbi:MAG: HAD-IA family hydrolase [Oscillospiraceae bacterium]|nr:HAD-IA family hydrolase [Oscillospiraceae bacterium]